MDAMEKIRENLGGKIIDDKRHWRVLTIGRSINGSTDIVSCLVRSLRNIGHKVLHIDPKDHRGLLDNPNKLQGGMGPIWISREMLAPAIKAYDPQMIIVLAGGMSFTPEDAAILRDQGIVLVGITLSDPDVFDGAVTFAPNFDFHTTNALHSYNEYKKHGVNNTLIMGFGIDRGFVTQQVNVPKNFEADVICLGHATSRPERNGVMADIRARLDDEYRVVGYGRGWELQDTSLVEGLDVIRAARGGRVHVNFPMTRAGFVNVKCGVFETIASGRLLATLEFEEMSQYFKYGEEILGYTDFDDLGEKIEDVLTTPGKAEWMAQNAFKRLVKEHLYEHRWIELFDNITKILAKPPEWLEAGHAARMRETLSESTGRSIIRVISGFYGADNVGDELIFRSISERIEEADPQAEVFALAENAGRVKMQHGRNAVHRRNEAEAEYLSRTASSVVLGGGGLWHDYTFERAGGILSLFNGSKISIAGFGAFPLMATMRGARFDVVGLGVGPLTTPDAKRMVNFLARETETITVRDPKSSALLESFLDDNIEVVCSPDTVYAITLPETTIFEDVEQARAEGRLIVGVNLRPWGRGVGIEVVKRNVTQALIEFAKTRDIFVYGVPMQEGATYDRKVLSEVLAALPNDIPHGMIPEPLTMQGFFDGCAGLDILLSMRLHANLVAHRMHVPCVGIAYDPKLVAHFKELGRSKYCVPLDADPASMVEAMGRAAKSKGLTKSQAGKLAALETEALARLRVVAKQIAATPARTAIWDIPPAKAKAKPAPRGAAAAPKAKTVFRRSAHWIPATQDADIGLSANVDETAKVDTSGETPAGRASSFMPKSQKSDLQRKQGSYRKRNILHREGDVVSTNRHDFLTHEGLTILDFRKCSFDSTAKTNIEVRAFELQKGSAWFSWPSDGPSAGQTASLSFDCEGGEIGAAISLDLTTYYGKGDRLGHVIYRVSVDDKVLGQCDLASAKGQFDLTVFIPPNQVSRVKFELVALQNLGDWNWIKSSRIRLSNPETRAFNVTGGAKVSAMNPYWQYLDNKLPLAAVPAKGIKSTGGPFGTGIVAALKGVFGGKGT